MTLTAINFVHVNGRSLYSVDWCMVVVEGGNVLHHVKSVGELSGGGEKLYRRRLSGGYVQIPDVHTTTTSVQRAFIRDNAGEPAPELSETLTQYTTFTVIKLFTSGWRFGLVVTRWLRST